MALTAPVPRPPHRFRRCESRWMTISRHPGSCAGPLPSLAVRPTRDCTLRPTRPPTVSPADLRSELGPRSLDPAALFGARLPSLFEARRRLPTSATALRRAGNPTRALQSSQGRRPRPPSFSSTCHALSPAGAVTRGEPRYVRSREPRCRFLLLVAGLPDRDAASNAPPPGLAPAEHSEDLRARVEGPSEGRIP